jgi:hypothetical protein
MESSRKMCISEIFDFKNGFDDFHKQLTEYIKKKIKNTLT